MRIERAFQDHFYKIPIALNQFRQNSCSPIITSWDERRSGELHHAFNYTTVNGAIMTVSMTHNAHVLDTANRSLTDIEHATEICLESAQGESICLGQRPPAAKFFINSVETDAVRLQREQIGVLKKLKLHADAFWPREDNRLLTEIFSEVFFKEPTWVFLDLLEKDYRPRSADRDTGQEFSPVTQ